MILLKLVFLFHFESKSLKIYSGILCFGCGFISNGFMVVDLGISINNSAILLTFGDNVYNRSIKSHARENRMARLAREGLLGLITKVSLCTYEHCLMRKSIRKSFGKAK